MATSVSRSGRPVRHGPYPELTWTGVFVGYAIGAVITISIGYAALILGFSIEGSELAAILGWGVLRGVMRRTSIIENNINQTVASAVNGASAGMMFSVPALFILGDRFEGAMQFSPVLMILACVTGGVLGLAFVIPLRKQMIDFNRLAYPGGIAVAAILKSPGAGLQKFMLMLGGAALSGAAHLAVVLFDVHDAPVGEWLHLPGFLNVTFYLSLLTIGTGFLSGRGGLWFGAGGFLCYFVFAPALWGFAGTDEVLAIIERGPGPMRVELFRPVGIGILIGAAVGGIVAAFPLVRSAIRSMQQAQHGADESGVGADEMPIRLLYGAVAVGTIVLVVIAWLSVPGMPLWRGGLMALLGTVWIWVAGVIVAECLGRTNWSPLSGMTLIAVTILLLVASGMATASAIVSSVIVGAAICVAIAQAGDMMLDLKSGYLVGATPRRQQTAQLLGTWLGPIIVMGLIFVLHDAYGLGSERLPAPQAGALAGMIDGIVGDQVPAAHYAAGAGLGALIAFSGLGGIGVLIGLGFYMPFNIVLTYTIGCTLRLVADRVRGVRFVEDIGIPVAAGLIVGEALVGVGNALYRVAQGMAS